MLSQEDMKVCSHRAFVIPAMRSPRMASAAIIRCHNAEAGSDKIWNDAVPLPPRLWETMEEHRNTFALASRDVVKSQLRLYVSHTVRQINLFLHVRTHRGCTAAAHFTSGLGSGTNPSRFGILTVGSDFAVT